MAPTVSDVAVAAPLQVELAEEDWTASASAHRERAELFLAPHRHRAAVGIPHPVWDFLFSYYSLRPAALSAWHPGFGVGLTGARAVRGYLGRTGYVRYGNGDRVTVDAAHLNSRRDTVRFVAQLLRATASRPGALNCFGMHEWAMVYRSPDVRHQRVPLRLGAAGTDAVVESVPLRCSHFDAYRFFTADAVPRNATALSRARQVETEQPGCLHANMDLYKWCYKLSPLLESGLLLDCLELAAAAREVDMRASPYDLSGYGFTPIRVEEAAGRSEYVRCQSQIAQRAVPLRAVLADRCDLLLGFAA